ncbi:MAG: hypothetical protein ABI678_19135 [Kofleriaceae bacterium]
MGTGGSQEAEYPLAAGIPAGSYHFELDAVIISAIDVQFDLVWRRGATDTMLTTFTEHYEPLGGGRFDAQPFEYDEPAPAVDFADGDKLVFRYSGMNAAGPQAYIPNGDGVNSHGRIPNITLPK